MRSNRSDVFFLFIPDGTSTTELYFPKRSIRETRPVRALRVFTSDDAMLADPYNLQPLSGKAQAARVRVNLRGDNGEDLLTNFPVAAFVNQSQKQEKRFDRLMINTDFCSITNFGTDGDIRLAFQFEYAK